MNLKELLRFEMITELCLFVWNAADMATVFQGLITVYYSISYWPPLL